MIAYLAAACGESFQSLLSPPFLLKPAPSPIYAETNICGAALRVRCGWTNTNLEINHFARDRNQAILLRNTS